MTRSQQGTTLFTAVLFFVATAVVIQLWLLTAAMDALVAGRTHLLAPFTGGSLLLFLVNAGFLRFVYMFERRDRSGR